MQMIEKIIAAMKDNYICNSCLGRICANLLSGLTNDQRGRIIRQFIALLIDSGEKIEIDNSNLYGIKFRNVKIKSKKPKKCKICKNFFLEEIDKLAKAVVKKVEGIEFDTFLIGSVVSDELLNAEEQLWDQVGIEYCEPIKSEINRELGKRIQKLMSKKFAEKNPDVTMIVDLNTNRVRLQIRSLYVFGEYQKIARGIPQTKWVCRYCHGKGCIKCKGTGKLYKTSIQEIVEKPLIKAAKAKKSKLHGAGREDIDARCLDYRQFIIELVKPRKRKIDLKKITKQINKSKKVKTRRLKLTDRQKIRELKFAREDKTYLAIIDFAKAIDKSKLKLLKQLTEGPILQKTPARVVHRRADKFRKRSVKKITAKRIDKKKLELKITAESGLYIKELVTGDEGRTKPSIAELLDNKVKKISLDVIKIHRK